MDAASVRQRLQSATSSDSRQLDRVCEDVATALMETDVEPPFTVSTSNFATDPYLICADRYWRLRFLDQPNVRTAAACAVWLNTHVHRDHLTEVREKWSLGYAFITKDNVESRHELSEAIEQIVTADGTDGSIAYFATLYHAGKLRSNFSFDELRQFLESSLLALAANAHRDDPLFFALRAFAAFGSRSITSEHAVELLDQAWNSPQRTRHVVDICLNGIQAAAPFERHGQLLRDRSAEAVRDYRKDHMFHFRLASGQHMCHEHDEALDTIDTALRLLPATGNRGSHKLLQEQFLAKRDAIQEGRISAQRDAEHQHRWHEQETANQAIRHDLRTHTFKGVELVTIFTAAIAFFIGSLQVTLSGSLPLSDRVWLIGELGAGLIIFAALIIGGTWLINRDRHHR